MDKVNEFFIDTVAMIIADAALALPVFLLWNNICMVFNCQPMTYLQALSFMVLLNLIKPINFNKINRAEKKEEKVEEEKNDAEATL